MGKLGLGAAPKPQMMPGKKRIKKPGEVEKKVLQVKIMFLKRENLMYVCRVLAREKNKGGGFYVIRGQDLAGAQSVPLGGGLGACLPRIFALMVL